MVHRASPTISSGSSRCIVRIIEADVEKVEVAPLFLDHHQQKQFRRINEFTLKVSVQSNWNWATNSYTRSQRDGASELYYRRTVLIHLRYFLDAN